MGLMLSPQVCVLSHMVWDCTGHTTDLSGVTPINDVAFESDVPGAWASDLYTVFTSQDSYAVGFQFDIAMAFAIQDVELSLFFCPSWGQSVFIFCIQTFSRQLDFLH